VHLVTAFQATEALKYLIGDVQHLARRLYSVDLWNNHIFQLPLDGKQNPTCPVCVRRHFRFLEEQESVIQEAVLCGQNTVQIRPAQPLHQDLEALAKRLAAHGKVEQNRFLVRLHLESYSLVLFRDGRVLIQGTDDVTTARRLYAQYVGM